MTATATKTTAPRYAIAREVQSYCDRDGYAGRRYIATEYHGTLAGCRVALRRLSRPYEASGGEQCHVIVDLHTGRLSTGLRVF